MPYTPILATLGYVLSPDGKRVLMIHRNTRPDDQHWGKYNGLGGKIEPEALNETNQLELYVFASDKYHQAVLVARLDNLGKGASGAAVQNMRLMLGLADQ